MPDKPRPELRAALEESWHRNEAAYRYLGGQGAPTYHVEILVAHVWQWVASTQSRALALELAGAQDRPARVTDGRGGVVESYEGAVGVAP